MRLEVTKRGPELDLYVEDATDNQMDRSLTPGRVRQEKPEGDKKRTVDCKALHEAMKPMKMYGYTELVGADGRGGSRERMEY